MIIESVGVIVLGVVVVCVVEMVVINLLICDEFVKVLVLLVGIVWVWLVDVDLVWFDGD